MSEAYSPVAPAQDALFTVAQDDARAPRTLSDLYVEPPVSTLDRRSGRWQARRRQWLSLGIQSELGRAGNLLNDFGSRKRDYLAISSRREGTSIFDPVLCELVYRWYTTAGDRVIDPFAGGAVRGMVAAALGRDYQGVDIRRDQVEANRRQVAAWTRSRPTWTVGDAIDIRTLTDGGADLVFTCPPYFDLEVYSDIPTDLSTMTWPDFLRSYREIIRASVEQLADDRFFVVVVGDVRDKSGVYRGVPFETERAMRDAGLSMYQEAVILDPFGSVQMMAGRTFEASRKLSRLHQAMLVGVKGSWKRAAARLRGTEKKSGDS